MAQDADLECELARPLQAWLGDSSRAIAAAVDPQNEELLQAEERHCVAQAVASRRAEFATGRVLARRAFSELGLPSDRLVMLQDRAPNWPPSSEASLSHAGGYCLFVARPRVGLGIGIDLEVITRFDEASRRLILTEAEQASFAGFPGGWNGEGAQLAALQAFSIKEALFKAMHGVGNQGLDFQAIAVLPHQDGTWIAEPGDDFQRRLPDAASISVWSARVGDFVVSAAALMP